MNNKYLIFIILCFITSCSQFENHQSSERMPAQESAPITYGMELTFTNQEIKSLASRYVNNDQNTRYQNLLIEKILEVCDGCEVEYLQDKYGIEIGRIHYPDGWYMNVTLDPSVVEVTGAPIEDSKLDEIRIRLNKDLYHSANEVGLKSSVSTGGGHIHFGAAGFFEDNPDYFRDFMVDMYNHSELGNGILADDHYNSPPPASMPNKQKKAFVAAINEYDSKGGSIIDLGLTIRDKSYTSNIADWGPTEKYQGINIERMVVEGFASHEETVEVRFIRPQQNADQFALTARLIKNRMQYLKKLRDSGTSLSIMQTHPKSKKEKFNHFVKYIEQTGESPVDYFRLMASEYQVDAWVYIKKNHPNNTELQLKYILEVATDSPYDQQTKARNALEMLSELASNNKELFKNYPQQNQKILQTLSQKLDSPSSSKLSTLVNQFEAKTNLVAIAMPGNSSSVVQSCASLLTAALTPFTRAP